MKWRDVIIGAIASLLVTVLGGVAVFYATKEPDEKRNEKLVYSLNQTAQFRGGSQDVAFSSLTLSNVGGVAAKHVSILISLDVSEIKDLAVSASKGLREVTRDRTAKSLRIVYESILPKDEVTINLLLTKPELATVDVRSDASLGEDRKQLGVGDKVQKSNVNTIFAMLVPATGGLAGLLMAVSFRYLRRQGFYDRRTDQNNAGFLLLHNGLTDEAESTLSIAVREGRFDQLTLSNYALCKAVRGQFDQAKGLLRAAKFRERSGHGKAVVLFNEGLIQLLQGDKDASLTSLREAISLSPKDVRRYCQRSVFLDKVRVEPAFYDLFKDV